MSKKMRLLALALSLLFGISIVAGCSGDVSTQPEGDTSKETESEKEDSNVSSKDDTSENSKDEPVYPLKGSPELTYWVGLPSNVLGYATNVGELPWRQYLGEETGIEVEYIHPPEGNAEEALNVLLASGDYPDIIEYAWPGYPGGVARLLNDGVIYELNELMEEYAPHLTKYYEENPEIARQVKSDDGEFLLVPFIRGTKELRHTSGPILRADWLAEANLEPPNTIDEWEKVLTEFKNQGCKKPFTGSLSQIRMTFVCAFDIHESFYPDDKQVKFGPIEDGYKEFLETMADWYNNGLLDSEFSAVDRTIQDANMTSGEAGSTRAAGGGQMGPYILTGKEKDPDFDLVSTPLPTKNPGGKPKYSQSYEFTSNGHAVITTSCENPEIAMRFLDYAYSEEGYILYNFGREGESFEYVDGVPTYSDLVMDNPDGLTVAQAMSKYCLANVCGPFVQAPEYIQQYYELDQQKQALVDWSTTDENTSVMPPITFTEEESDEVAKIMADINTYNDEMTMKFIMGKEPVSKIDEFQSTIKDMGIDRAIELYQKALDRYYAR